MIEISAVLGKMWSETGEKARTPFVKSSEKSKAKFDKEMEVYRQTPEYSEFQKRRNMHMLIKNTLKKFLEQKGELYIKCFQLIQINLINQQRLSFCSLVTTVMQ
eukprot:UN27080